MPRVAVLRAGYATLALAFGGLALSAYVSGALVFLAFALSLVGAGLLIASDDDLPRYAGLTLVGYLAVSLLAFLAATPVTIRLDFFKGFLNGQPSPFARMLFEYLALMGPLMFAAAAAVATWERERPARALTLAAAGGFVLVGALTFILQPRGVDEAALASAAAQGKMLATLFAVSGLAGAIGSSWAAARPDEYA